MNVVRLRRREPKWRHGAVAGLLVYLVLGVAAPVGAGEGGSMAALREIGRQFARIAEQAYPGVAVIAVERPISAQDTLRDALRRRTPGSRSGRFVVPDAQLQADRDAVATGEALMRDLMDGRVPRQRGQGLGIIVSADGHIVTNHHIVRDANGITVKLADGRSFQGKVIGADPETDIAVVKIAAEGLRPLELGDSEAVRLGDWVIGIGNPLGIGRTFTVGLVTGKGKSHLGMADYEDFLQTDAPPHMGDGGGPLLDLDGRVVAMNTAVLGREYGRGIGLAIPVNMVKTVYEQLVRTGTVERGFLGIVLQDMSAEMADSLGHPGGTGALVTSVVADSPAGRAGLKNHDVIVAFNGKEISSSDQLRHGVAAVRPGTEVEVVVVRDGQREKLTVTLGTRPSAR